MGARRRFAAITGSKLRIESYPLVASTQHVGAAAAVTVLQFEFMLLEQYTYNQSRNSLAQISTTQNSIR